MYSCIASGPSFALQPFMCAPAHNNHSGGCAFGASLDIEASLGSCSLTYMVRELCTAAAPRCLPRPVKKSLAE